MRFHDYLESNPYWGHAMRILFITNVMDQFMDFAPLGIMYLSSALKKAGHQVKVCGTGLKCIFNICAEFRPQVIGYGLTTGYQDYFLDINRKIRQAYTGEILSIFGGPHVTYFPELIHQAYVDAVFRGECEAAIVDFIDRFEAKKEIYTVKNVWVKDIDDPGIIHKNPSRELIDDINSIVFPDRKLISEYMHRQVSFHTFLSSRGCPYNCSYCFNKAYRKLYHDDGHTFRRRSVDNIIEELAIVKHEYPLEHASFQDDEFCGSAEWLADFSHKYKKHIGKGFSCNFRPNLVTEEKVKLLKDAGLRSATMAFESGNDYVRNTILKRNLSQESMLNAARIIKSQGIFLAIQNIVGIPGGSLEADFDTLRLNTKAKPDYAWVSLCNPYPGTELGDYAQKNGYFDGNLSKILPTYHLRSPLKIKNKREIENLHKLFAFAAEYPQYTAIVKLLIKLPLTGIYDVFRKIFKGWIYYEKDRFGIKFKPRDKIKNMIKFLTEIGG